MKKSFAIFALTISLLLSYSAPALPVEKAVEDFSHLIEFEQLLLLDGQACQFDQGPFDVNLHVKPNNTLKVSWCVQPGNFLYRDKLIIRDISNNVTLVPAHLPKGLVKHSEVIGEFTVFEQAGQISVPFKGDVSQAKIQVSFQGCSNTGICFPPMHKIWSLNFVNQSVTPLPDKHNAPTLNRQDDVKADLNDKNNLNADYLLTHSTTLGVFLGFLLLGGLLSLTPCVLPMIPILFGIIMGKKALKKRQIILLTSTFVLCSALTYALLGVVAASIGYSLQSIMQTPWVLGPLALLFFILGIGLLGAFEFQVPAVITNTTYRLQQSLKGGQYISVGLMGILAALVISPCVAPPLVGALAYIAHQGSVLLGGLALFALGLGMGAPLLLMAIFGAYYLPKAGPWMNWVKKIFGVLLIAVGILLLSRFMPIVETVKSLAGYTQQQTQTFHVVTDETALNQALGNARHDEKPVLLLFSAKWCTTCQALKTEVFPDETVQTLLSRYYLIEVDMTHSTPSIKTLLKRYSVFSPPVIRFYNQFGHEEKTREIIGAVTTTEFIKKLQAP